MRLKVLGQMFFVYLAFSISALAEVIAKEPKKIDLSENDQVYLSRLNPQLQPLYRDLIQEGKSNDVLNRMRIGAKSFFLGEYQVAKRQFELSRVQIEALYSDSQASHEARSLWHEEGRKDFKGEPYERAMTYFYLGVIAMMEGQYDYAHAAFKNGIIQDSFAEEDQHIGDFAAFYYLAIWCAYKMGSDHLIRDFKYDQRLTALRPDLTHPRSSDNTIIIALSGKAPRKLNDGVGGWQMVYRPGKKMKDFGVSVSINGITERIPVVDDLYFQASTRGGRAVDKVIEGKVSFQEKNDSFGGFLSSTSNDIFLQATALNNSSFNELAAVGALGVIFQMVSNNVKTKADTRSWDNLPNAIHVSALNFQAADKDQTVEYEFQDKQGNPVSGMQGQSKLTTNHKGDKIVVLVSN